MSFIERVRSWRVKAVAREAANGGGITSYNLRGRYGQGPLFDMAMTVMRARGMAQLKNSCEKIDHEIPLATLIESSANGQTDWILIDIGNRKVSVKRRSLSSALQAFGIANLG